MLPVVTAAVPPRQNQARGGGSGRAGEARPEGGRGARGSGRRLPRAAQSHCCLAFLAAQDRRKAREKTPSQMMAAMPIYNPESVSGDILANIAKAQDKKKKQQPKKKK